MRSKRIQFGCALAMAAASTSACAGKVIVTPVPASVAAGEKKDLDGVVYALPRTVVTVAIPVVRTHASKGRYADLGDLFYPDAFKRAEWVSENDKVTFAAGRATFGTFGEPDLARLYHVKLTGGLTADRTASLDYSERGTVSGVQAGAESHAGDLALAGLSALTGVIVHAPDIHLAATRITPDSLKACLTGRSGDDTLVRAFLTRKRATELAVNYCRLEGPRRAELARFVRASNDRSDPTIADALRAYQAVRDLRDKRRDLITQSGLGAPLPALELMLKEIDAAIAIEMGAQFSGQRTRATWTPVFEVRPYVVDDPPVALLKLEAEHGICWYQPLHAQDEPPPGFTSKSPCAPDAARTLQVAFALDAQPQLFQRLRDVYEADGDRSFRYIIPAAALVTLQVLTPSATPGDAGAGTKVGAVAAINVAQFGTELSLPASSGGASLNYTLRFFEATGALKSFTLSSKAAAQAADVNAVSSSTNALLDARNKQAQAAQTAADTLTKLERRRQILEEEAKIRALCTQLGLIC